MTEFTTSIRAAREAAGLTQAQAAERAGWHRQQWYKYESGRIAATETTMRRMAEALGCELRVLVDGPEG